MARTIVNGESVLPVAAHGPFFTALDRGIAVGTRIGSYVSYS